MPRVLLLGGTFDSNLAAAALARAGVEAVYSYAGRTDAPAAQPLPTRVGGFGGVEGMLAYFAAENITHVIDATHPFAAQISDNAARACDAAGLPLLALVRAPWRAEAGDRWHNVADTKAALAALPSEPARVFLAIGKQNLAAFAAQAQHHYLLRLIDPPAVPPLANCTILIAKGPFDVESDTAMLRYHQITHIVAKNAGGSGARAKLVAARTLGLPVIMIARPPAPLRAQVDSIADMMTWLAHHHALRGV